MPKSVYKAAVFSTIYEFLIHFKKTGIREFSKNACAYHRGALLGFLTKTVHQKSTSTIIINKNNTSLPWKYYSLLPMFCIPRLIGFLFGCILLANPSGILAGSHSIDTLPQTCNKTNILYLRYSPTPVSTCKD